jgi:hypothetical protein
MPVYTYTGNRNKTDGTSVLNLSSNAVPVGQSGLFTEGEYQELSLRYFLLPGAFQGNSQNFAFQQASTNMVAIDDGNSGAIGSKILEGGNALTTEWKLEFDDGGAAFDIANI